MLFAAAADDDDNCEITVFLFYYLKHLINIKMLKIFLTILIFKIILDNLDFLRR